MPDKTYTVAIFIPNIEDRITRLPKSTIGEEIKKEKVTPVLTPAAVKPINRGIDEQEQKGVTVPNSAARIFALTPLNLEMISFVL